MPRVQSDDYDAKRSLIMDKAAQLFAESSYPSARMMDIAGACGASKSMLYHYFPKKEHLLFAILKEHLEELIEDIETLIVRFETKPAAQKTKPASKALMHAFAGLLVQTTTQARTRHLVAMLDVKYLPDKEQAIIKDLERKIVSLTSDILRQTNPELANKDYSLYALLLIGIINSMDIWRNARGRNSAEEMAQLVCDLFLNGYLKAHKG